MILRTWLSQGGPAMRPLRVFSYNIADSKNLKFIKYYFVSVMLAIGFHGLLFIAWEPILQTMRLPLQVGKQAVSLQFIESSSIGNAEFRPINANVEAARTKIRVEENSDFLGRVQKPKSEKRIHLPLPDYQEKKVLPTLDSLQERDKKTRPMVVTKAPSLFEIPALPTPSKDKLNTKMLEQHIQNRLVALKPNTLKTVELKTIEHKQQMVSDKNSMVRSKVKAESLNKPSLIASKMATFEPEGVLTNAQPQSSHKPKYPRRAIVRNQQGRVKVRLFVDKDGQAINIELIESSGYALLDKSVLSFVEQERFFPATRDGKPVSSTQLFLFSYVLE